MRKGEREKEREKKWARKNKDAFKTMKIRKRSLEVIMMLMRQCCSANVVAVAVLLALVWLLQ